MAQEITIHDEIICDTCLKNIEFLPARVVTMKSLEGKIKNAHFHYFFPCWDFDYLCQRYPEYDLINIGFIYDSDYLSSKIVKNLKKNEDLWV
ncbi:MAG: hypothetical protein ACE5R3_02740 [Nitrosopumilaceae archaeon]